MNCEQVCQIWLGCALLFLSYLRKTGGGIICPPPVRVISCQQTLYHPPVTHKERLSDERYGRAGGQVAEQQHARGEEARAGGGQHGRVAVAQRGRVAQTVLDQQRLADAAQRLPNTRCRQYDSIGWGCSRTSRQWKHVDLLSQK